jgi:hypothetical protein
MSEKLKSLAFVSFFELSVRSFLGSSFFVLGLCCSPLIAQVNESELKAFFDSPRYGQHFKNFNKVAKAFFESEMKKYPPDSLSHQNAREGLNMLKRKDPGMQAPPFCELLLSEKGDIGLLSINSQVVPFVKVVQVLPENRFLFKAGFEAEAEDDAWSAPFLIVDVEGLTFSENGYQEGAVMRQGFMILKRIDNFSYLNRLNQPKTVAAFEVLDTAKWGEMVLKNKKVK